MFSTRRREPFVTRLLSLDFGRSPKLPWSGALTICAALAILAPTDSAAQMEGCQFGERGRNNGQRTADFGGTWYIGGPHFVCDDGAEIFADSVVIYEERGRNDLIGNVRYYAGTRQLFANQARYFTREGRLQASGNVRVLDLERGSEIENGDVVLLLANSTRESEEMQVTTGDDGVRPRAVMTPPEPVDSAEEGEGEAPSNTEPAEEANPPVEAAEEALPNEVAPADTVPPTPYVVVSDRMLIEGSGSFVAVGDVEIERDSLFAWADSTAYDGEGGGLDLIGSARVESETFEMSGETILMGAPGAAESRVEARRSAHLIGDDLEITSALILIFLRDDALDRLVATPIRGTDAEPDSIDRERPWAVVETFELTADSLDVVAPSQRVERVFAAGRARSVSSAGDSLNVELLPEEARSDWLEGDTIVVTFEPAVDGAEEEDMTVRQVVARIGARSLYRLPPNDSTAVPGTDPPAVHYVTGQEITIRMEEGQVAGMEVIGQTRGIHLEPLPRRPVARTDSLVVDSLATDTLAVDTLAIPFDRIVLPRDTTSGARLQPPVVEPIARHTPKPHPPQPHDGSYGHHEDRPWTRP